MTTISVQHRQESVYEVTVREDGRETTHEVTVTPADATRYGGNATVPDLVRASFEFLLEREPKESILRRFDLPVIERYFPEYPAAIAARLGRS